MVLLLSLLALALWCFLPSVPCRCARGCECGKGKGTAGKVLAFGPLGYAASRGIDSSKRAARKTENRAEDLARQQAAQAATTQQAVQAGTAPTPQEQGRINATFGLEQRRLPILEANANASPEELVRQLGPLAGLLQQRIQQRLQTPPSIPFEDTFNPEYQLLRQNVLGDAARRGFGTGSGLEIEQLGRAGVDLAIKQAALRMQNAQVNQGLQEQSLSDAAQFSSAQQGLSQQAREELAQYLQNQQQLSEAARGRQTQGVVQSYQTAEPFQARAGQFQTDSLAMLNQRAQQAREDTQKIAASLVAIGAAPFTGGTSLMALPGIYGGGGQGGSAAGLLEGMRQANAGQQPFYGQGAAQYPWLQNVYSQYPQKKNWWGGSS